MTSPTRPRRPKITLTRSDHARLTALANGLPDQSSALADELLFELERARIVKDGSLGPKIVRVGSTLSFRPDNGPARTVTLVYPPDADIERSRISVMTPIGAALIGLSEGQSIDWRDRTGGAHVLEVLDVQAPAEPGAIRPATPPAGEAA
ncbi:nucleoside diphosphate kinase regulator [Enterovirga rhinocerotis]|uniref:Regulator of nucleoside diphosphate kinase n=1 Tax=Enterovirga rhinocerotis TaxID=1339210 RepID=A0A4R7BWU1_9HYPH|nr:nucleoside diphosphate kinase regulator [Enterovirga rhinocerotis]TDR90354.1 regulator of nucleoside diphosphate kinase [Enterovirga rhinocerotis]